MKIVKHNLSASHVLLLCLSIQTHEKGKKSYLNLLLVIFNVNFINLAVLYFFVNCLTKCDSISAAY